MPIRKKTLDLMGEPVDEPASTPAEKKSPKEAKEANKLSALELIKTQSLERVAALFDTLKREAAELEDLKRKTGEELERKKEQTERLDAERQFDLLMSLKKKQAEFDEKLDREKKAFEEERDKKEEELKSQKEFLATREKEFEELKSEAELFPQKIEKVAEEARKEASEEAKKEFESEKKLLVQKYDSDLKLLNQQITTLQNFNKHYERESALIKEEKTRAVEQFKELAVAVVRGKSDGVQSTQNQ